MYNKYIYIYIYIYTNKAEILNLVYYNNIVKLQRQLKRDCVNSTTFNILQ